MAALERYKGHASRFCAAVVGRCGEQMALVKCNLCGNNISSKASICPKCGCPTLVKKESASRPAKNCSECEYGGVDGEYACNLCDSGSFQAFKAKSDLKDLRSGSDRQHQFSGNTDTDLLVKIDDLDIGSDLKNVFVKIFSTPHRSRLFGIKGYTSDDSELKYFKHFNSLVTVGSNLALVFGPFYYFIHGMWKKGIVLLLIQLALFSGIVFGILPVSISCFVALLGLHCICYCSAKYDRYRKLVLDEEFWW